MEHVRAVHVVLLLHLIRGDDDFQMTFDTRWTYAFVDSIGDGGSGARGDIGLPTALNASGKSVLDVVSGLDPSEVGSRDLRPALSFACSAKIPPLILRPKLHEFEITHRVTRLIRIAQIMLSYTCLLDVFQQRQYVIP